MTATIATSAAPSYAIKCWVDGTTLFFELQGQHGPAVVGFARHELNKALSILYAKYADEGHEEPYHRPEAMSRKLLEQGLRPQDLEAARKALKDLGILK